MKNWLTKILIYLGWETVCFFIIFYGNMSYEALQIFTYLISIVFTYVLADIFVKWATKKDEDVNE